jgi:hypothetical protein
MRLQTVDMVNAISGKEFREKYFSARVPVVLRDLAKEWPAFARWNWNYFKSIIGHIYVGIHDNRKDENGEVNLNPDEFTTIGRYIDMIRSAPVGWRIFLFDIYRHAPKLLKDFAWPEHLMDGFKKDQPLLFAGGQGSVTHMHFDIDLANILHTQFLGKKRVLLFPYQEQHKLYRKPFEDTTLVNFSNYYDVDNSKINWDKFPALKYARGYEVTLEHGDTLYIPSGYWHHVEYIENGIGLSLRSNSVITEKIKGSWNIYALKKFDSIMKRTAPFAWLEWKQKQIRINATDALHKEQGGDSFVPIPGF